MGIIIIIDFKVTKPKVGSKSYLDLVSQSWVRKMKANIFLEKDIIKLKGQGKNIIIPLDPKQGKPWEEPDDTEVGVHQLYQVMQSNTSTIEPNNLGELYLRSPISISRNSNYDLYDWEIKKYESYAKDY